jgi:hypothetical protein
MRFCGIEWQDCDKMLKYTATTYFRILTQNVRGGTEENHKSRIEGNWFPV